MGRRRTILGWPLAGWRIVGTLGTFSVGLAVATLVLFGINDEALGVVARNAARVSLVLFSLVFASGPLARLFPGAATRWLVEHRPYFGVSFVVSHLVFLGSHVLRVFAVHHGDFFALRPPIAWYAGGALYVVMLAMAVTSFPTVASRLSRRAWKALHVGGSYLIAATFLNSYGQRVLTGKAEYVPALLLLLTVAGLRLTAFLHRRIPRCRALLDVCLGPQSR